MVLASPAPKSYQVFKMMFFLNDPVAFSVGILELNGLLAQALG